jgi:hypothetical protein
MSMVPLGGLLGSSAGVPLSQSAGNETERAQKDSQAQHQRVDAEQRAERSAGIGQTEQDQESSERDADGRRPWESTPPSQDQADPDDPAAAHRQSKDPTGQSGTRIDITG